MNKKTHYEHDVTCVCDRCDHDLASALAISERRELVYDELEHIFQAALVRADYASAYKILDIFGGRDLNVGELEQMLESCVDRGSYDLASHAAKMAGRSLAQIEKDRLAIVGLRVHGDANQVVQMAIQGLLSAAAIEILIGVATDKCLRQTANFLREKRRKLAELEKMLAPAVRPREVVPA